MALARFILFLAQPGLEGRSEAQSDSLGLTAKALGEQHRQKELN